MSNDIWTTERAAFACFRTKLEDSYKRLLFIRIIDTLAENPNMSANHCYSTLRNSIPLLREDFDAAVCALIRPFGRLNQFSYTRTPQKNKSDAPHSKAPARVQHLHITESKLWDEWLSAVLEKYPELSVWQRG